MKPQTDLTPIRTLLIAAALMFLAGQNSSAQQTLKIRGASRSYDMTIREGACDGRREAVPDANADDDEARPARLVIYRKGAGAPFQVLCLPSVRVYKDHLANNSARPGARRVLYDESYTLVFGDFNFDGREDFAVCNGANGGYGGPSYDVYVFDKAARKFVENRRLSRLAGEGYLGMFSADAKRKLLVAQSKSGCCYHETQKYKVVNDRPRLVEKVTEDAMTGDGVTITTVKLVNGKWVKRVRRERRRAKSEQPAADRNGI